MSYESPINIIRDTVNDIVEMRDNKEELLKALAYDRDQYNKGYLEGYKRGLEEGKQAGMIALANSILKKWGGESEDED